MKKTISNTIIGNGKINSWSSNFLFLLIAISFLFGCGNNSLSRSEAESIIKKTYPKKETHEFYIYTGGYSNGESAVLELSKRLEKLGLVKLWWEQCLGPQLYTKLTEKGHQYVVGTGNNTRISICKVSDLSFGAITGISQQKGSNEAFVNFTQIRKITPFGQAINLNDGPFNTNLTLIKFDDGWRIK